MHSKHKEIQIKCLLVQALGAARGSYPPDGCTLKYTHGGGSMGGDCTFQEKYTTGKIKCNKNNQESKSNVIKT